MASSAGYANRLSKYDNKGVCGLPEIHENERVLKRKLAKLAELVCKSKYTVLLTGAGVSTSTGIPDFRGPTGIWTSEQKEEKARKKKKQKSTSVNPTGSQFELVPSNFRDIQKQRSGGEVAEEEKSASVEQSEPVALDPERNSVFYNSPSKMPDSLKRRRDEKSVPLSFEDVKPSLTHKAITFLVDRDIVKFCITQNVDGLHQRSGLSRSKHAVLHGCVFTEKCEECGKEYFRDFDVGGMSFKKTGRKCSEAPSCNGDLRDTILDWDDALPEDDWKNAQEQCSKADLVITLGTSLRIEPAGSLPLKAKHFVVVNLQQTPLDKEATLKIGADVDKVMSHIMNTLGLDGWEEEKQENVD
mmetsp:Transcript_5064/g.14546  ORF Transcript_5064/g.14546 Transcript_5064/m.14546 type:complete len:357 (-) Transcript_5064:88-1158(-)|eukprot:CAMPEP_0113530470 /NCGR_PEP_ID=MMETSP0015_2-20120614/2954_1 /TAXON_ID=2838 /ORGANISM="Odontella" /LENGTH=356 /DNA_ID=CAMNT_0000429189 /DNA_START=199 /DNA_END=1269 /DNA_ORIENTATION=- /assembly_acc=CAM_ASM_000160